MFIFNKKRIIFLSTLIVFSIFYSGFASNYKDNLIETSSTPIANHTIILDAGHGIPDGGAVSNDGKIIESNINLNIVLKLQNLLESSGCKVILTRSNQNGIYETDEKTIKSQKISDMKNRVKIGNNSDAELFLSIHMNKLPQSQYFGWQTFYKNKDITSKKIAQYIQTSLNNYIGIENNRQIKSISKIYLTKHVTIPLVLVECGFLSNEKESHLLQTDTYQNILAWSIYIGILEYFEQL